MSDRLREHAGRVVGVRQVTRALAEGRIEHVYLASDAERRVTEGLVEALRGSAVPITRVSTMAELGHMCAVAVETAAAGLLRRPD